MLKTYQADLHIHSCLSPCGEEEMRPRALVNRAKAKGLDMIAICDHNSAENAAAFIRAGEERALKCSPEWKLPQRRKSISSPSSMPRRTAWPSKT